MIFPQVRTDPHFSGGEHILPAVRITHQQTAAVVNAQHQCVLFPFSLHYRHRSAGEHGTLPVPRQEIVGGQRLVPGIKGGKNTCCQLVCKAIGNTVLRK